MNPEKGWGKWLHARFGFVNLPVLNARPYLGRSGLVGENVTI